MSVNENTARPRSDFIYTNFSRGRDRDFIYTKNSARPGSDFIYTKNSARRRDDFIYTKNFLRKIVKINDIFKNFPRCARQFVKNFLRKKMKNHWHIMKTNSRKCLGGRLDEKSRISRRENGRGWLFFEYFLGSRQVSIHGKNSRCCSCVKL
jgi:hypothetical protein